MAKSSGRVLLMFLGSYDPSYPYDILDIVDYNDKKWVCVDPCTGETPSDTSTYWRFFAQGGKDGVGIVNIQKTGVDPLNPLIDIYTIYLSDGNTTTFTVTNATGGSGSGDNRTIKSNPQGNLYVPIDESTLQIDASGNLVVAIDDNTLEYDSNTNSIVVSDRISKSAPTSAPTSADKGKIPVVQPDGSVEWQNGGAGGHDMLDDVSDIEALTDGTDNKVANAYAIKHYSNRFTSWIESQIDANTNSVTLTNIDIFKNDDATFEFMFEPTLNASGEYEYLTLAKYTLDTINGDMTIEVVEAPTVDIKIRIDVTEYREYAD